MERFFPKHDDLGYDGDIALGKQVIWQPAGCVSYDNGHLILPIHDLDKMIGDKDAAEWVIL
jgi:hypothetical protein